MSNDDDNHGDGDHDDDETDSSNMIELSNFFRRTKQ